MNRDYPIPSYAAYIWIVGSNIHVCFPPSVGSKSHTVIFPANDKGLKLFLKIMQERRGNLTIGHAGEPTKYQVERMLVGDPKYNKWLDHMHITDEIQAKLEKLLEEEGL